MGTLYLVGTPIGNLEDITLRALRILGEVSLIAAEDTRSTGRLLAHYDIKTPLTSFHEHNKLNKLDQLLDHLKSNDLALVSDAGMPGLSDPGFVLVRAAIQEGITIAPVPGPSAVISALVASGLPTDAYIFIGFLPKGQARRQRLKDLGNEKRTVIAFEAPQRLLDTLTDMNEELGNRPVVVARELTKLYEEFQRGAPAELIKHFTHKPPKGEITLVIGGAADNKTDQWSNERVVRKVSELLTAGKSPSETARTVAKLSGRPRRDIYKIATRRSE